MAEHQGDPSTEDVDEPRPDAAPIDPVALLAILCGVAAIFVMQLVLSVLTLTLAALAGSRAKRGHGDISWAYLAFGIGAVDGILVVVSLALNGSAPPKIPKK